MNAGSRVEIVGVPVGRVQSIELDGRYAAIMTSELIVRLHWMMILLHR